jgi:hypothetical protein
MTWNKFNGQYSVACYWKNGVITPLSFTTDPTNQFAPYGGKARGIALYGSDIYVVGSDELHGVNTACYWKNGVITHLDNVAYDQSEATGITIQGNDVYISGYEQSLGAVYWKDGVVTKEASNKEAKANSIAADGNGNVYLAGFDYTSTGALVATGWNKGANSMLAENISAYQTSATGITLQGTDVLVSGIITPNNKPNNDIAVYWKNGTAVYLTNDSSLANAYGITTQGNDIYVVGEYTFGPYSVPPYSPSQPTYATYWKNGKAVQVSNLPSSASAILIVPH